MDTSCYTSHTSRQKSKQKQSGRPPITRGHDLGMKAVELRRHSSRGGGKGEMKEGDPVQHTCLRMH